MSTTKPANTDKSELIHPQSMDLKMLENTGLEQADPDNSYTIDLSCLSLIRVSGADAESFLQGQFSNDLGLLENGQCQLHAYCNPKGRALAIIRIMRSVDGFWMVVPQDLSELLLKRLRMFVLRAKANIDIDTGYSISGIAGDKKEPDVQGAQYLVGGGNAATPMTRHFLIAKSNYHQSYHSDLWRWMDIQSGIPQVYAQTTEVFIPQTINLDLVDGINFRKGCFPGQEIVARIKYLGKLKQRMLIATADTGAAIQPGEVIIDPLKPDQKSGMVVDAVNISETQSCLSAMVPATMIETGELRVGSADGAELRRIKLPYSII